MRLGIPDRTPLLADTSVWIHHLRTPDERILHAARRRRLRLHPMVLGELACSNLPERPVTLAKLRRLPSLPVADDEDVLELIETRGLSGRGVGWIDLHFVVSCRLAGCRFLTDDKRLAEVAAEVAAEVLGEEKVWR